MNDTFGTLLKQAVQASQQRRWDVADAILSNAIEMRPSAAEPYYLRAANHAENAQNDAAEADFIACLTRAPNLAIARFQLGLLQLTNGRAAAARATWEPLLAQPAAHPLKYFAQAFVDILQGNRADATAKIREGIATNANNAPLNRDMSQLLARLAEPTLIPNAPHIGQSSSSGAADEAAAHFLISSYGQP